MNIEICFNRDAFTHCIVDILCNVLNCFLFLHANIKTNVTIRRRQVDRSGNLAPANPITASQYLLFYYYTKLLLLIILGGSVSAMSPELYPV